MTLFTGASRIELPGARAEVLSLANTKKNTIHPGQGKHIANAGVQRAQCHFSFTVHALSGKPCSKTAAVDKIDLPEINNRDVGALSSPYLPGDCRLKGYRDGSILADAPPASL